MCTYSYNKYKVSHCIKLKSIYNFIINKQQICRQTMAQVSQLPLETVVKNLADSVALQFHLLSKKCVTLMKKQLQNKQQKRLRRREALLVKYKAKIQQKQKQPEPIPDRPNEHQSKSELQQGQPEESRLARINRIKEAMFSKQAQQQPYIEKEVEKEEQNYGVNMDIVFHYYSQELRPQILAKYPSAPHEKVNKVILQKWSTFDLAKKEAYIKKIKKKMEMQQKKKNQDEETKPMNDALAAQINTIEGEVKRQETIQQYQSGQARIHNEQQYNPVESVPKQFMEFMPQQDIKADRPYEKQQQAQEYKIDQKKGIVENVVKQKQEPSSDNQ